MMSMKKLSNVVTGEPNLLIDLRGDSYVYLFPPQMEEYEKTDKMYWEGIVYSRETDKEIFRTEIGPMLNVMSDLVEFKDEAQIKQDKINKEARTNRKKYNDANDAQEKELEATQAQTKK